MVKISAMNLEVTTACPLHCPQCYCTLDYVNHLPYETALYWIKQAEINGVESIALSGGETRCYPYLLELVGECANRGLQVHAAFSGWEFTPEYLTLLKRHGISSISISLNGSTKEINALSRDGYVYAIRALSILSQAKYNRTIINWVMHSNNSDDFCEMLRLAEQYNVYMINIISFKPDRNNELNTVPTAQQITKLVSQIFEYRGPVKIVVESCFSPLRAVLLQTRLLGNLNNGINKGCRAGLSVVNVSVDGLLSPCRHLCHYEKWDTLEEYWNNSEILKKIRNADNFVREPCKSCKYEPYCRHCLAINDCINNDIYIGNQFCSLSEHQAFIG